MQLETTKTSWLRIFAELSKHRILEPIAHRWERIAGLKKGQL